MFELLLFFDGQRNNMQQGSCLFYTDIENNSIACALFYDLWNVLNIFSYFQQL
jgi:hypothetical protein